MKIFTTNPIIINGVDESSQDLYIPLDGSSSRTEIQMFQDWLDMEYPTWLNGGKLNKGSGYGNFGANTKKAWSTYGAKYTKENPAISKGSSVSTPDTLSASKTPLTKEEKRRALLEKAKAGLKDAKDSGLLDKALGLFGLGEKPVEDGAVVSTKSKQDEESGKGVKIALIIGGVALVGAIIYFATKKK